MENKFRTTARINTLLIVSFLTLSILVAIPLVSLGKNYYFSTSIGNDSYTSTQAQNQATPWKTIKKLNSIFSSLQSGDSVLLKRGEVFYGTIIAGASGTAIAPIVIGSYGVGNKPIISAFQTVTGWTNMGNNIWESAATACKSTLNMVTINGVNTPMGRFPNSDAVNGGYLNFETSVGCTSITDNELTDTPNWTGAEVVIRKTAWVINRCPITDHTGGTLTYTDPSGYGCYDGWGYFIQNDIRTLDANGEWFLNKNTKKLSMYFSDNNPNGITVRASIVDTIVYCSYKSYLTFTDLSIEGGNEYGFNIIGGDHILIKNCNIDYMGEDAIYYPGCSFLTVTGCNLSNINDNVISGSSTSFNSYIGYCNINKVFLIPGNSGVGDGHGFGIALRADNSIAEYNTVKNAGYTAISMSSNNTIIRNNYIDSACLIKDDGGAIYISGAVPTIMSGRLVQNNIVRNALGNGNGKTAIYPPKANCIYVDGYGNNVTIEGNTVTNASAGGIYLGFYSHDNKLLNNTSYNNLDALRIIENDLVDNNCTFTGNIFATNGSSNLIYAINGSETKVYRPIESFGTWSGNYYIKPFDDKNVMSIRYNIGTKVVFDGVTLSGWSKYDPLMKTLPIPVEAYKVDNLIGSSRIADGTFTSNTTGFRASYYASSAISWDNTNKITGGTAKLTYTLPLSTTNSESSILVNVGSVTAGKKYILKFDVLGSNTNKAVMAYLCKSASPYTPFTPKNKYYPFSTTSTSNEILFEPTLSDLSTNVCLVFRDEDGIVYIDNVSFYEADVTKNTPDLVVRLEYNASLVSKTISLSEPFVDVKGVVYNSSITLQPYTSALLFKNANSIVNKAPTIANQTFQLLENSVTGTVAGTVIASDANLGQVLTYSIVSGNTNNAFTINSATGIITVSASSVLNYEVTPKFALVVKVQDNGTGALSSQATVTVNLLDINESPVVASQSFSVSANALNGTVVGTVSASDPDLGQILTYSILNGNTNGAFAINPATGVLTVATSASLSYLVTPVFSLVIQVQDNATNSLSSNATVNVTLNSGCSATGTISFQVWNNIGTGSAVSALTSNINYPDNPTSTTQISLMEAPANVANEYGARIAGYICAPATGAYTFWISSDDNAELWLSTNDLPANKQKIAYQIYFTGIREWNKYAVQKSVAINLIQGQKYYIEALMKEGSGYDNLAVGWLKPGQTGTAPSEVIPGSVLSPLPVLVSSISIPSTAVTYIGSDVILPATVSPANANNNTLNWTSSNQAVATVNSSGIVTGISEGITTITATSTDGSNKSSICTVTVALPPCSATGSIMYQVWNNIGPSSAVSALTSNINYPDNPTSYSLINSMEATSNVANEYGARMAGYICAPATGAYTFWISADDNSELWLSTSDQPSDKVKIASHIYYTALREWNKYASQKSVPVNLVQGQKYYIEALMKEGSGYDNLAVGWLKPGQTGTVPSEIVPGSVLSPIVFVPKILVSSVTIPSSSSLVTGATITLTPTILPVNADNNIITWTSSNPLVATVNESGLVTGVSVGTATITATSTDGTNKSGTCLVTVILPVCSATGSIMYQVWNNIGTSSAVSALTSNINYPDNPTSYSLINSMEAPSNVTNEYGARMAGYICAPATGAYTFWISADDNSELWLSTNDQPANKVKIASHIYYTASREWNKYASQKSVPINLVQGQKYYIEALMKEGSGYDYLAVGWLKPGQTGTVPSEIVPGSVLSPIVFVPKILVSSVTIPSNSLLVTGATITLTPTILPANADNSIITWTSSNPLVATVNESGLVTGVSAGTATITATSTDGTNKSGTCLVTVSIPVCSAVGTITYQVWNNIGSSSSVSALTSNTNYPDSPTSTTLLSLMEAPTNVTNEYGARIAGYICAPITGAYTFWISADDNAELWLSTNDQPTGKVKIAYHIYYTGVREWNKYTSQKSASVNLVQGQRYYIEALMKEGTGYDNMAVGWLKPGQSGTVPSEVVPGSVLSPLGSKSKEVFIDHPQTTASEVQMVVYPNPLNSDVLNINLENISSKANIEIYSVAGVIYHQDIINNSETLRIDRSTLKSGIYFVKAYNNEFVKTTKLIVK